MVSDYYMFVFAASALLSALFLTRYCAAGHSWPKSLVKTGAVAGLSLAAGLAGGPVALVAALALGAVGDFFLSRPGERAFLAGLVAFALAHLAYVWLMVGAGGGWPGAGAGAVVGLFSVAMAGLLWSRTGPMRWPVMGYVAIIGAMGLLALSLPWPVALSALAFMASDTILSFELFVLTAAHPARRWTPYAVWSLYWGAQAGFAWVFALSATA